MSGGERNRARLSKAFASEVDKSKSELILEMKCDSSHPVSKKTKPDEVPWNDVDMEMLGWKLDFLGFGRG